METILLSRDESSAHGTFGRLFRRGRLVSFTGELPWRDNEKTYSCIPADEYECRWHLSPRFGWVYLVVGVPGRTDILLHAGNYCGDRRMGLRSHTWGCILQGQRRGSLGNQRAVLASRPVVRRFFASMGRRPFRLRITERPTFEVQP